jgi:RNA polymerase sigma-70 factor (family 1)
VPNASEMANSNEILSLYKHDERAALQKLFDIYYEPLLLYCYRLIRDSESAEDIVQDCFVHIWRSRRLENFEGELDRFMFQAIKFRAINYVRDQYRRDRLADNISEENDELPTYFQEEEAGKEIELLHYTISCLPDECRKIFLMACLDDMKYREIAETLNISINTVKTQMKIALRFLREHLTRDTFSSILLFISTGK